MTFPLPITVLAFLMALATAAYSQDIRRYGCLPPAEVTADITARELASATRACVEDDQPRRAIQLYLTYSSFIIFDQQRVKDESAHLVVGELNSWILTGYEYDKMQELKHWIDQLRDADSAYLKETCAGITAVGPPTYRPDYMIKRGMQPRKSDEDWVTQDFDPVAAWDKALYEINPCPRP
ncbi:MAG: hypothetical protein P8L68_04555 [Paracoccaceae bacterium]|nr:hypothetical protein [Paracoccaceae bacterium]MDG2257748.1 hypothetical protein [Paracoccaceae bacterium]